MTTHDAGAPLRALRLVQDRSAERTVDTPVGPALLNDSFAKSYAHNYLRLKTAKSPQQVITAADEALGHLGHRCVLAHDANLGKQLESGLAEAGYSMSTNLIMVHAGSRPGGAPAARVAEWSVVRDVLLENWRVLMSDEDVVRQLVDRGLVTARACRLRYVVADTDGRTAASADLRQGVVGGVAQIEEVGTLPWARGSGLATAIVLKALQLAYDDGESTVFLVADQDDWPASFYQRLGFSTIGSYCEFTRHPDS